jgi:hypothetical protein
MSYAAGPSGLLGYGDLTAFTLSIGAVTHTLADVLPLIDSMSGSAMTPAATASS